MPSALAPLSPLMYMIKRVIELAHILDRLDDAANLVVGVGEVSAEHIGLLDEELLLVPAQLVPLLQAPSARA